jgi:hypothetical protein
MDLVLQESKLEVGDSVHLLGADFSVLSKRPTLRLRHSFWRPSSRHVFDQVSALLQEARELSDLFGKAEKGQMSAVLARNKRKAKDLADSIRDVVDELDDSKDLDEPSQESIVFELSPNQVSTLEYKHKRVCVCYVADGLGPVAQPVEETFRMGSFNDLTTDGQDFFVPDRFNSRVLWMSGPGPLDYTRHVLSPAPMVCLVFDPETQWTFGLQNDPPRLWRFRLLPRHQSGQADQDRARFVRLGKERTAFFGCLWLDSQSCVWVAQSSGFEDSPHNPSTGVAAFLKQTLEGAIGYDAPHCWTRAALELTSPFPAGFEHAMAVCEARHGSQVFLGLDCSDDLLVRDQADQAVWSPRAKVGVDGRVPGKPRGLCWRDGLFMLEQSDDRLSVVQLQH